jgi:hypothetical protein
MSFGSMFSSIHLNRTKESSYRRLNIPRLRCVYEVDAALLRILDRRLMKSVFIELALVSYQVRFQMFLAFHSRSKERRRFAPLRQLLSRPSFSS